MSHSNSNQVVCVEREDFGSGTSSRSTKLVWAGSRYLVQALVNLLSFDLIKSPRKTMRSFLADFKVRWLRRRAAA